MDEADFSEDTTSKQQEDLPYDGDFSQVKIYSDCNFTSKNDVLDVSNQITLAIDDPQEKTPHKETCRNEDMAMSLDKMTEDAVNKNCDEEKQCTVNLHIPADKRHPAKSNISDILLHHLSKEEFLKGQGINCETLPEISNADSFDETISKNIILQYVKHSWPKEQTPELTDQLNPKADDENSNKPTCSPTTTEGNSSDVEELSGDSSQQEKSNFPTKIESPSDKQKSCQGQTPQKQQTEKASSGNGFKHGQDQVHCLLSDFSKVAPKVKIPKSSIIEEPITIDKQANFSPNWRYKSAIMQDILENMSRSNCVEIQEPKMKTTEPSEQIEMEPTIRIHQEHLTGLKPETSLFKLSSASQKDPSSSSCIFQKLSQGKQMCQKLKEQTDQLKTKIQEFSKSIAQDSSYRFQDKRLVLEKLQGRLELLEQEFLAKKEKHLSLKQQVHKHEPPAVGDFDPERKVEGEIFKLEMLLEDVKEKIDKGKCTSALSLPVSSPIILDELASTSSPSLNEEDPGTASGGQERAERTSPSCAFCLRVLEWKQKMEKEGHRRINCGRFPNAIQDKARPADSILCYDTVHSCYSCYSTLGTGLQNNKREDCGSKTRNSRKVCGKEPAKEFHYRYNIPGQNYLNCSERRACVPLCFLNENKNSSPSHSKPNWICSQRANSKSSQDEREPIPGKKDLKAFMTYSSDPATPLPHFHSCRISGSTSLSNFSSTEDMEAEILNSSLDHALRTATTLKQTTDQMIRTIAEDLAKIQRWRNQLKY
ncbi:protein AKNAD1 isoform X1 [Equus przewalskii]|uniref:Protein AKNAD1 isoform X1 n=1 Tax=Equus przewalskii TaxID=9798 RepID=A0ABM4NG52_EQUPR|nr:protein AKNAD1 isoform X1 [Equus caballus]XP_023497275.1 protein AKNAD1 isoform X1 [Equus caballus]